MPDPHIAAYWALVAFSSFSLGAVAFWAILNWRIRPWLSVLKVGYLLTVGTLLWVVIPNYSVEPTVYFWLYTTGLALAGIGALGDLRRSIRIHVERVIEERDELGELP